MALEGDLSIFRLPDILQVIAQQQKTGILTVQGENDILAVSFLEGSVVAADALNQSFEETLGDVLASQGILSPERFQGLSEEHRATAGERLADFLVRRGALSREELLAALRFQTYRLLLEVLSWREGEFKFYTGEEVAYEEGMEPLPVDEVLYRSMRDLLGEGTVAGAMPHGFVSYVRVPTPKRLKVAEEGMQPPDTDADVVWISPDERTVLDRLDGRIRAEDLARETGLGDVRTQYAMFHLLRAGLVRPAAETPPEWAEEAAAEAAEPEEQLPPPLPFPTPAQEGLAGEEEEEEVAERAAAGLGPAARKLLARCLAGFAAAAALLTFYTALYRSPSILLPFPAQTPEREGMVRLERLARYTAIDHAARSFYLLEGRYPASLEDLVDRGLLESRQRFDPLGRSLLMRPTDDAYALIPAGTDESRSPAVTESVDGDVLLDRNLFAAVQDEAGVPLILLD
jgi:hypothetical protein